VSVYTVNVTIAANTVSVTAEQNAVNLTVGQVIGSGESGVDASNSDVLRMWAAGECYTVTSATRDSDGVITTATVSWPDGSAGAFTTVTKNATFLTVDAYTVTHTSSGKTVTQPAVTRDASGNVTAQPAITIAP